MVSLDNGGEVVRYTTKELLAEIREGVTLSRDGIARLERRLLLIEDHVTRHDKAIEEHGREIGRLAEGARVRSEVALAKTRATDHVFSRSERGAALLLAAGMLALNALALFHP